MRKILCSLLLFFAAPLLAQSFLLTGTGCTSVAVGQNATAAFQVTGSWSGTIQPKSAVAGQAAANSQVTPAASTTAQSTVTGNGAFTASVAGYSIFQLCGATVTGTAKVFLNLSRFIH
jgi:hypothetical protein